MEIRERLIGEVTVLELQGEFVRAHCGPFTASVEAMLGRGGWRLVLVFNVSRLDKFAEGEVGSAAHKCRLRLVTPPPLRVGRPWPWKICPSVEDAVQSLATECPPSLNIVEEDRGDVTVLHFAGDLTRENAVAVYLKTASLRLRGRGKLLLRLREMGRFDSVGMAALANVSLVNNRMGGRLAILDAPPLMYRLFDSFMGAWFWGLCDSEEEALARLHR